MKKLIEFLSVAALLLTGCTVKELEKPQNIAGEYPTFYASCCDDADKATKTYVDDKMTLRWTEDDRLSIFVGNTFNHEYKYDGETGANNGTFSAVTSPEFVAGEALQANYAVYPYNGSHEMNLEDGLSVVLPSVQKYAENSFGLGANTMVAATENKNDMLLQFKNLCGYIVVKLYGEGTVTSIKLEGNNGEKISGKADVRAAYGVLPSVTMSEEATTAITLDCGEGVTLGTSTETATEFWFCVPPVTFNKGFTVTATNSEGWQMVKSTSSSKEVVRNTKNALAPIEAVFDKEPDDSQVLALEREALIAIYNALDGDNWSNNENWCSEKPVGEWYGVETVDGSHVSALRLSGYEVQGKIPSEVSAFIHLRRIELEHTSISSIPKEFASLPSLSEIRCTNSKILLLSDLLPFFQNKNLEGIYIINTSEEYYNLMASKQCSKIPEEIFELPKLKTLWLDRCNLYGNLPSDITKLTNLRSLTIRYSYSMTGQIPKDIDKLDLGILDLSSLNLTGGIPECIYNLTNLSTLTIDNCRQGGTISPSIGKLCNLTFLNLRGGDLEGELPKELAGLLDLNLNNVNLIDNKLSGKIPSEIINHKKWPQIWGDIVDFNNFELSVEDVPAPEFSLIDIYGNPLNSDDIYKNYNYLLVYDYDAAVIPYSSMATYSCNDIRKIYDNYCDDGLFVLMIDGGGYDGPGTKGDLLNSFVYTYDIPWPCCWMDGNNNIFGNVYYPGGACPSVTIIDNQKNVIFSSKITPEYYQLEDFLITLFGENIYSSTDYSVDGTVVPLQTAKEGNGINVILMGDGYSDRQISNGTYEADMKYAYASLFNEEPYYSYKDMFNVYYVNVVSKNEGYKFGQTAIDCYFGKGTLVGGKDDVSFTYALNAITEEKMDETLIIVVMNSDEYAGTCYLYYPANDSMNYSGGVAVAYFPKGSEKEQFAQLLYHEALGHGFAKLGDEYAYEYMGTISNDEKNNIKQMEPYGWYKNVDFTSDPTQVKWSRFLSDERYANEGLGCFEGGLTYWNGVWRPTDNSIMRYNTGGFNAPSREAIWYRIHKLAYGEDWQYNYEDFVAYDAINRTPAAQAASRAKVAAAAAARKGKPFQPLHEPVVVKRSWKDAVNNSGKEGR